MADTRKAEQQAESEAIPVEQRSVFGTTGTVGLAWSEEALEAVKNLKEDETEGDKILQLVSTTGYSRLGGNSRN